MNRQVTMIKWTVYGPHHYGLSGFALDHPRGAWFRIGFTSELQEAWLENNVLHYVTEDLHFLCPLKYIKLPKHKSPEALITDPESRYPALDKVLNALIRISNDDCSDDSFTEHVFKLAKAGQEEISMMINDRKNRLIEEAKKYDNCLYIELSNIYQGDLAAYHIGDLVGTVSPFLHVGMSQDSVLFAPYLFEDPDSPDIDYRYFPRNNGNIETYFWSSNIERLVVKNALISKRSILVDDIEIVPGATKLITR